MANPQFKIVGSTKGSANLSAGFGNLNNVSIANAFRNIGQWFQSVAQGARSSSIKVFNSGVQATGTITLSSSVATDTVTINGTVFTQVASGATGNQFNHGATDTLTAVNLAAAINASATTIVKNNVSATSALAVVTVTCNESGTIGNLCTLAISAHGSVSAANLAGGTDGTVISVAKGL